MGRISTGGFPLNCVGHSKRNYQKRKNYGNFGMGMLWHFLLRAVREGKIAIEDLLAMNNPMCECVCGGASEGGSEAACADARGSPFVNLVMKWTQKIKIGGLSLLATALSFTSCKPVEEPKPTYNIVRLPFGYLNAATNRATPEQVLNALTSGADSVYIVSYEDFDQASSKNGIHSARDDILAIRAATRNSPKVEEKGVINPTVEVAAQCRQETQAEFEANGFKYIPGYQKQK